MDLMKMCDVRVGTARSCPAATRVGRIDRGTKNVTIDSCTKKSLKIDGMQRNNH